MSVHLSVYFSFFCRCTRTSAPRSRGITVVPVQSLLPHTSHLFFSITHSSSTTCCPYPIHVQRSVLVEEVARSHTDAEGCEVRVRPVSDEAHELVEVTFCEGSGKREEQQLVALKRNRPAALETGKE